MKVWLYSRLSRDEDDELNSLKNQQNIIREYAEKNCYTIVGESFDDNVSGMHFNREGINKIYEAVENKLIDAVIVKDMSRLGRHKTQTALFIDYLRENDVKVLSVTENLDTSNENDDLITSFEVALQTIRKVKARVIEFWDSLFPDWRDFKQDDLKIESLKRHNILFGSTRSYCKLCVLSPTEA